MLPDDVVPPKNLLHSYCTYIGSRVPKFKIHNTITAAQQALRNAYPKSEGIIFEYSIDIQDWVEYDRSGNAERCHGCGRTPLDSKDRYLANPKLVPQYKSPVACASCYQRWWHPKAKTPKPAPMIYPGCWVEVPISP